MADAELERDLARLRERYRRKLPASLVELADLLRNARAGGAPAGLDAARLLAHRLKGTAGSYGFRALGERLARIEEGLGALMAKAPSDPVAAWSEIERELDEARAEFRTDDVPQA